MMQFHSISDFFNMGGYGFYVWLSYGMTVISLATLIFVSHFRKKQLFQHIKNKIKTEKLLKARRSNIQ